MHRHIPALRIPSIYHVLGLLCIFKLKNKTPAELLAYAEELEVENASTLRTQDMMFGILKQLAENSVTLRGSGVLEVLSDGF